MSGFESIIWTILGYTAMPLIFIGGYLASAAVSCFILNLFNKDKD
ncbi:MAG TPA: TIGR02808 family protein [Aeromonadales bacterium]|nr:TIGR02808 family protein [Aeromonadales bacterium]